MGWKQERPLVWADAGDVGGDIQLGRSYSVRYVNDDAKAMLTVYFYPCLADDEVFLHIERTEERLVYGDLKDPTGTEIRSEYHHESADDSTIFAHVKDAEHHAEVLAWELARQGIDWITWDGESWS